MERIGIYGGTFNPPHVGHIYAARQAARILKLDKLLMVPTGIAPHKQLPADSATPAQRLEMLQLAIEADPELQVSDIEIRRDGPSYTWETVQQLQQMYPDSQLILLMGTDMFLSFWNWREPEKIAEIAELAVLYRGDANEKQLIQQQKRLSEEKGARVTVIENETVTISSTDLRRMLIFDCASEFLPKGVEHYIRENGIYGTGKDCKNLSMPELETVVIGLLKPNRVAHVLGCRDTAVQLARHWGADEEDAARAGILHDITKALDGPLQLTLCRQYGMMLDTFSENNPKTLHALTGSLVAERIFGENQRVVDAIYSHTTGKANMNLLEKIIYVADYMEPVRNFPGVERLRELAFSDLDGALELGLQMTLELLIEQKREISPGTREALADLKKKRCAAAGIQNEN